MTPLVKATSLASRSTSGSIASVHPRSGRSERKRRIVLQQQLGERELLACGLPIRKNDGLHAGWFSCLEASAAAGP